MCARSFIGACVVTGEARLALVSGGCAGIGAAIVERLLDDGFRVLVADITAIDEVPHLVSSQGIIRMPPVDLTDEQSLHDWLSTALETAGDVHTLVHCAGIYPAIAFEELSLQQWRHIFSLNLEAFFLLCQGVVPGMRARGEGRLIGIASNTFHDGTAGLSAYVASKGGMIGMVRSLASELGALGIAVNAVAPGITDTPTTRKHVGIEVMQAFTERQAMPKLAMPEDYAGVVSFLAGPDAGFLTGQTLIVDGGWTHA